MDEIIKMIGTGDIHGYPQSRFRPDVMYQRQQMKKKDICVVFGDHGYNFSYPATTKIDHQDLKYAAALPFEKWLLDGNHENHNWLAALPVIERYGGKMGHVYDNLYTLKRGEIYTVNGKKIFAFGGALSIDKALRTEGYDWWSQEIPSEEEFNYALDNLAKHDFKVDYVFSHTCPESFIRPMRLLLKEEEIYPDKTSYYLDCFLKAGLDFSAWYFAHWHVKSKMLDEKGRHLQCLYNDFTWIMK